MITTSRHLVFCLSVLVALPLNAVEPITVITTAAQLLKELNELNRGVSQGTQLADISSRLEQIQRQMARIEDKLDEAVASIHRLEQKFDAETIKERNTEVLAAIRTINRYYPGWEESCLKNGKILCDADTRDEIREAQGVLLAAVSRFMERDSYANIHVVVLAMGYERDLLVLLNGQKHAKGVFTQYQAYLEGGTAHLDTLRVQAETQARALESRAAEWATKEDWCWSCGNTYIYDGARRLNCRYCGVEKFAGDLTQGWTRTAGYGVRDGQGASNCYDPNDTGEPHEPKSRAAANATNPPMTSAASCDATMPVGGSCEYLKEHRNCAVLNQVIASRTPYLELVNDAIPGLKSLQAEVQASVNFARDAAAGKALLKP